MFVLIDCNFVSSFSFLPKTVHGQKNCQKNQSFHFIYFLFLSSKDVKLNFTEMFLTIFEL